MPYARRRQFRRGFRRFRKSSFPYRRRVSRFGGRRSFRGRRMYKRRRVNGPERNRFFTKRYCFKYVKFLPTITFGNKTLLDVFRSFVLTPAYVDDWSTRTAGFEQYKFYMWKLEFIPVTMSFPDPSVALGIGSDTYGLGWTWHYLIADYNDSSLATITIARAENTPGVKKAKVFKRLSMIIRPKYETAVSANFVAGTFNHGQGRGWLELNGPATDHYGFKYAISSANWTGGASASSATFGIQVRSTVWYGVKNINAGSI